MTPQLHCALICAAESAWALWMCDRQDSPPPAEDKARFVSRYIAAIDKLHPQLFEEGMILRGHVALMDGKLRTLAREILRPRLDAIEAAKAESEFCRRLPAILTIPLF